MGAPVLILPTRYTSDSVALWKAALEAGWHAERLQNWRPPQWLREREVVIYGEPLFAWTVAEALGLVLLEPPLDWLATLPHSYVNRDVYGTTLGSVGNVKGPAFIKPADDKCFTAKAYASGLDLLADTDLPENIPVLVSEVVSWEVEYRCFVREQRVVTLSPYFRYGELAQMEDGQWPATESERAEALEFAQAVLGDPQVLLPPAAVVDVGKIAGRGWSVVEANPAWSSGIYGCDPIYVLDVLHRACVKRSLLAPSEQDWLVDRAALA